MMIVHAAKGLEFPIVILAVPGSPLLHEKPGRHLDPDRELCLLRFDQLVPSQLAEVEPQELVERLQSRRSRVGSLVLPKRSAWPVRWPW